MTAAADFERATPYATGWAVSCPWCGRELAVELSEDASAAFEGAMGGFVGDRFTRCEDPACDCPIEIASVEVRPLEQSR